ncbi:formylglycine-generating enzyme family protein [Endozoicomonas sp. Mp262]|uniref:formylglycine-generating enzyme family protein n=1 Tax=Endozoicomonas sp. Mp262 TaxID=2919499 RepID=UPI0021D934C0
MTDKTLGDLVEEVSGLTSATTSLLNQVTTSKATLDKAEKTATASAASAKSDAATATTKAAEAKESETNAKKSADSAAAVVTGGTASLNPAAGKIPLADGNGRISGDWVAPYIKDSYRHAVESATGGKNTVLYDSQGNANVMVVIPRFTYDDIGMTDVMGSGDVTAFVKDGDALPEIFIGKYLASSSSAASMPGVDPRTSINFDTAKKACEDKGSGWHLMTAHEWAAVSLWCIANGYQPTGNTQYGRSHENYFEFGRRGDGKAANDRSGAARTNTGSGPAAWAHDKTDAGVYDLVGNVWEWQLGLKTQDGRVICTPDNDFAMPEASWVAQDCYFDSPAAGDESDKGSKGAQFINSKVTNYAGPKGDNGYYADNSQTWDAITKDPSYVSNELMKRLLIEPVGKDIQGRMYIRNYGERLPFRGGRWAHGSGAGLAALGLFGARSNASSNIGFRPAFAA